MRALAALSVVWVHARYAVPGIAERLGAPFFGASGVDVFFVISGFIMVAATSAKELTPASFLSLRIIRIAPLYWLATLALAASAAAAGRAHSAEEMVKSVFFIPYRSGGSPSGVWPILENGWTLNFEMFFYALFSLALAAPGRVGLPGLVLSLGSLAALGRLFGPFESPCASVYTSPRLLEFAAGMTLAQAWGECGAKYRLPQPELLLALGLYCLGAAQSPLVIMGGAFLVVAASLHPRIRAIDNRPMLAPRQCVLRDLPDPSVRARGARARLAAALPARGVELVSALHAAVLGALRGRRLALLPVDREASHAISAACARKFRPAAR